MLSREQLNGLVDKAADIIRGATDYQFILLLLFYKRMSDVWEEEFIEKRDALLKEREPEKKAEEEACRKEFHDFAMDKSLLWNKVTASQSNLAGSLQRAFTKLGNLNPSLKEIVEKQSFRAFLTPDHEHKLFQLVQMFNEFSFSRKEISDDIIGDAYEHLLYKHVSEGSRKSEGEFYTPREVISLMVELLDPKPNSRILDPACGSGGMLIMVDRYLKEKHNNNTARLEGQEQNRDIYAFGELNLLAHGVVDAGIFYGDSLLHPRFKGKKYDFVLANPPWNLKGYSKDELKKSEFADAFKYGYTNSSSADWAWVQLMLAVAEKKVAVVLDQGVLFRGGAEGRIREEILKDGLLEAVILLPGKLFYNTMLAGVVCIFNKEPHKNVFFIDSTDMAEKHPSIKKLDVIGKSGIEQVVTLFRNRKEVKGTSKIVSIDEIEKNGWSLNFPLYISRGILEAEVDISKVRAELASLYVKQTELLKLIDKYLSEVS